MKAEIVAMTADAIDHAALARGGEILKQGGLVAFPTETVYGLGGNALDPMASKKIYAAKGRPSDNPLIVHIADLNALAPIVKEVPEKAKILAEKFWLCVFQVIPLQRSLFCRQGDTWQRQVQILLDGQARLQHSMLRRT